MSDTQILQDIRERVVRLETKLDAMTDIKEKVDRIEVKITDIEARAKSNTHRIDKLEANNTWLWRTLAGATITAIISAIIAFFKGGGGN